MIICGSLGLGDAVYLWPVVRYLLEHGIYLSVVTRYPEVYENLNCEKMSPAEFEKNSCADYLDCRCSARTKELDTNVFEDVCILAGIEEKIPFEFKYFGKPMLFHTTKKVCVIRNVTTPTGGEEDAKVLTPDVSVFQKIIDAFSDRVYFVTIGMQKNCDYKLTGIDLDLSATNNLRDYFSILDGADIVLTQPGHCVPIAEGLDKKLFTIFAQAGLESEEKRFRFTTPSKILTKSTSNSCVDSENPESYLCKFEKALFGGQDVFHQSGI